MSIKFRILLSVFLLELLGYGILLFYTHQNTQATLISIRERQIQATIADNAHRIDNLTRSMEHKVCDLADAGNMFYALKNTIPLPQLEPELKNYLINTFSNFPESIGGGLWYEPNVFDPHKTYYGPYVFWNTKKQVEFTWDLNTQEYDYHHQSWYLTALPNSWPRDTPRLEKIYWTNPYWDEAGSKELMMTVDAFLKNTSGNIIGLATVDWSLREMTDFIQSITLTEHSKTFLIDTRSEFILSNSLFPESVMSKRTSVPWMRDLNIDPMHRDKVQKIESAFINDDTYYIYYLKTEMGLLLGIAIPINEFNQEIENTSNNAIHKGALIILFFILCMLILLEVLFRPFQKVHALIRDSIKISADKKLDIRPVEYQPRNEFSSIIDAINLTYDQINHYTKEIELANKAKTTFLTTMSHEIRTPMNAILGYTQLLALDKTFSPEHQETVRAIDISGKHLLDLLNDILDISKIESGGMQVYKENIYLWNVLSAIDSTFKLRCQQKNLQWHCKIDVPRELIICCDKAKLSQILINLLGNSIKFTEIGSVSLHCNISDAQLHIHITDTGAGITKAQQAQLFTPFFQGSAGQQYGGTGLGLTIVNKLVALLSGKLHFESLEHKGTHFSIHIPLEPACPELAIPKQEQQLQLTDFSAYQLTAFVIDDVKINRDILAKVLLRMGIKSIQAENGVDGLRTLKQQVPDLLFVDIQMPVMDGFEFLERLKSIHPQLVARTIAISANVYQVGSAATQNTFHYFISKPFIIEDICKTISEVLDKIDTGR